MSGIAILPTMIRAERNPPVMPRPRMLDRAGASEVAGASEAVSDASRG